MENRIYFIIGDILSVSLTGGIVALTCLTLIPADWNMFLAMFAGMIAGMLIALVLCTAIFMRYFGIMEVMLPSMLSGMLSGMIIGMAVPMFNLGSFAAACIGVTVGLMTLLATYLMNNKISGTQYIDN